MPILTYDTSVFIAYRPHYFPAGFVMSAVVIQELTAGAADWSELQHWDAVRKRYVLKKKLIVPNGEDWWLAGRDLNSLLRGLKSYNRGLTPKLPAEEKHRLIRDVLIARSARRVGAIVVTNNVKDFQRIARFCAVRTVSGGDFFSG